MLAIGVVILQAEAATPQGEQRKSAEQLEKRVAQLEAKQKAPVTEIPAGGTVFFLFGAFCALWAQNTNRNPWLWFFFGLFFSVITVLALLANNADDRRRARGEPVAAGSRVTVAIIGGIVFVLAVIIMWQFWRS
jgi:hypothetical protein